MSLIDLLLLAVIAGGLAVLATLWLGRAGSGRQVQRRLQAVRLRHSDSQQVRMESQLKKAIAARRPNLPATAGPDGRIAALALRLERTGRDWSVARYFQVSGALGVAIFALAWMQTGALPLALGLGVIAGAGLPHMIVTRLIGRRLTNFTTRFPDALELLVRGLRSGLPVSETLGVIASEIPGPVGREFRAVVERIRIGRTMEEALQVTADKLGTPEFQFFVVTLAIQRETGGNLAETLANLADVLRKRAQMKLKVKAMSSESKASAYIVGALPFLVFGMIWYINPPYVAAFATDERLTIIGLGAMVWMGLGAFIMAKMVSFEI